MGSIKVIKHKTCPVYRLNKPGTESTLEEVYKVTWVPSTGNDQYPGDQWLLVQASTSGSVRVPKVQSRYNSCDSNFKHWIVDSVEWRPNLEAPYSFTVNVRYYNMVSFDYGTDKVPWTRITRTVSLRQAPMYRDGNYTIAPYMANYHWPPTADIGGDHVDINGAPSSYAVAQCQFTIEFYWHRGLQTGSSTAGGTVGPLEEPPMWILLSAGTRNTAAFLGFPKEQVLFQGYSASPINNQTYLMQYRFLFDQWGFFEQRPAPAFNGLNNLSTPSTNFIDQPYRHALKVAWYQPYVDLLDFQTIFPTDVYAALPNSLPAQNSC